MVLKRRTCRCNKQSIDKGVKINYVMGLIMGVDGADEVCTDIDG